MIFISSLTLSRIHFSQNFWCATLARAACASLTATSLPPPSIQLIICCLTEASASCSTKRHMKHFSKMLENHLPKRKRFFSSYHHYQQTDTNVELKGRQFFRSLVTGEMKPITTSGYSTSIQTPNVSVLMGLNFYLWPWSFGFPFLPGISIALQPAGRNRDIARLRFIFCGFETHIFQGCIVMAPCDSEFYRYLQHKAELVNSLTLTNKECLHNLHYFFGSSQLFLTLFDDKVDRKNSPISQV